LYASPTDPEAWLQQIAALRGNDALRAELSKRGKVQSTQFSWATSAERYLELMAEVDAVPRNAATPAGVAA
jgi:glycosyltransferase involved in cell wall biosynthesis